MKPIDNKTLSTLREKIPFAADKTEEALHSDAPDGIVLQPYTLQAEDPAGEGDLMVIYHTRETMERRYREAIRALELQEAEAERFGEPEQLEHFGRALEKRLDKVKLWHYAPEQRDEVKAARTFLRNFLSAEIPYGERRFIPADERESFWVDAASRFGVEGYYHCHATREQPLEQVRETIVQAGHRFEERLERLVTGPIHRVQHLAESVIDAIPDPIDGRVHLMSA